MSGYHIWCDINAHNCGSGCCTLTGTCATAQGQCFAQYIDYSYPDLTGKYQYPGFHDLRCNALSRNCSSGCCKTNGDCAASSSQCQYQYADYRTSNKYSYGDRAVATISLGPLAGGIIGGVVALVVVIGLIIWYKKKQSGDDMSESNEPQNNGGMNVVAINNPQESSYGMVQPLYNPSMNSPPTMYTQETQQIYSQPTSEYQQGYTQPVAVFGNQGQGQVIMSS